MRRWVLGRLLLLVSRNGGHCRIHLHGNMEVKWLRTVC
jgi:hypothetical protein